MLVLSRKEGQKVVISDNVTLVIQRIAGKRVSIGIEAPDEVSVVRSELQQVREQFSIPEAAHPAPLRLLADCDAGDLYPRTPK